MLSHVTKLGLGVSRFPNVQESPITDTSIPRIRTKNFLKSPKISELNLYVLWSLKKKTLNIFASYTCFDKHEIFRIIWNRIDGVCLQLHGQVSMQPKRCHFANCDQYPLSLNRDRDRLQNYWSKSWHEPAQNFYFEILLLGKTIGYFLILSLEIGNFPIPDFAMHGAVVDIY